MIETKHNYDILSTREGFNTSLRHFNLVMDIIEAFEDTTNLADFINELCAEKEMLQEQIKSVIHALLFDKYKYSYATYNLKISTPDLSPLCEEIQKWHAVDIVLVYYHPELGITTINPKNMESWEAIQSLKKNELITIFVGEYTNTDPSSKIYDDVIIKLKQLLDGKAIKGPSTFTKGKYRYQAPRKKELIAPSTTVAKLSPKGAKSSIETAGQTEQSQSLQSSPPIETTGGSGKKQMTPMYGITVTNELFHNGNVEAWKKIITSYEHYHQGLEVLVFYDGEKINDINTLFKWGKVKRGTAIMISVVGESIKNVAKLKRYLMQGASNRFEAFLKGSPTKILKLF